MIGDARAGCRAPLGVTTPLHRLEGPRATTRIEPPITEPAKAEAAAAPAVKEEKPTPAAASSGERVNASPLARRIAADKGVDLAGVTGSGPNGRIVKADLDSAQPGAALLELLSGQTAHRPAGEPAVVLVAPTDAAPRRRRKAA